MAASDIRGLLVCFSPSSDFFATSSGDGRVKIWDTVTGQLRTEFTDLVSKEEGQLYFNRGHLSVDYTCMKWLSIGRERKSSRGLIVLGTGSGDVFALDGATFELNWKSTDLHPGGVIAISSSTSCIFSSGSDGMVCELEPDSGSLIRKFKASEKAVTSVAVSADGTIIATAAAELKVFDLQNFKKIQKFSGHPGAVRCMTWTKDGNYLLSCAVGERYVVVWRANGDHSASCVLGMEHPAVFLDCTYACDSDNNVAGLYVWAISEIGVCYFWYGRNLEELQKAKPSKLYVPLNDKYLENLKESGPAVFAVKLQDPAEHEYANVFVAHGLLVKPTFQKIVVHTGEDVQLELVLAGGLLPLYQTKSSKKRPGLQSAATALDRANAEGALLPIPKLLESQERFKQDEVLMDALDKAKSDGRRGIKDGKKGGFSSTRIESRLMSMGILIAEGDHAKKLDLKSTSFKVQGHVPPKKIRAAILPMESNEAYKFLTILVSLWESRMSCGNHVLPWICCILVNHFSYITSNELGKRTVDFLYKITKYRGSATRSLLKLFGQLELATAQIGKGSANDSAPEGDETVESEDEDVDEVVLGEEPQTSSSDDDA